MAHEIETGSLALLGSKFALDVLGPSAKVAGRHLKDMTRAGLVHLRNILEQAYRKRRSLRIRGGEVSPRVLPALLRSSLPGDDEVIQAYFAGVLCSSISRAGRDDRAVGFIRVIEGLSTYALRAHFIVYSSVALQKDHKMSDVKKWLMRGDGITIAFDEKMLRKRMKFVRGENGEALLEHAFVSLSSNDLCMQGIRPSMKTEKRTQFRSMHLTIRGVELYCWANGFGQKGIAGFFDERKSSDEAKAAAIMPAKLELGHVNYMTA